MLATSSHGTEPFSPLGQQSTSLVNDLEFKRTLKYTSCYESELCVGTKTPLQVQCHTKLGGQ